MLVASLQVTIKMIDLGRACMRKIHDEQQHALNKPDAQKWLDGDIPHFDNGFCRVSISGF